MLDRRSALGALALAPLGVAGRAASPAPAPEILMSAVLPNQGEAVQISRFNDPAFLRRSGYRQKQLVDGGWLNSAVLLDDHDARLYPKGSAARAWVERRGDILRREIAACAAQGVEPYGALELIVLPKTARALYGADLLDAGGKIDMLKPRTIALHRAMFRAIIAQFPGLKGVIVRTGENYLHDAPHHDGNTPLMLQASEASREAAARVHSRLIQLLREEFAERGVTVLYRTWAFGGIHTDPDVYRMATDPVVPHPRLIMSIKHTRGDYHRNFAFNPTLGIGRHKQSVEVQCAREYEGKGAYPNYVAAGVIDGFEELRHAPRPRGLRDLAGNPRLTGLWTWARGGGWKGPYIENELWPALNAHVMARWANARHRAEPDIFDEVAHDMLALGADGRKGLRALCLLSADAIIRGRSSLLYPVDPFWIRDEFIGGVLPRDRAGYGTPEDQHWGILNQTFDRILARGLVDEALGEKDEAVRLWRRIDELSRGLSVPDARDGAFIRVSSRYGLLLHEIIAGGWGVALRGYAADHGRAIDRPAFRAALRRYDAAWGRYRALATAPQCPTLYRPYRFIYRAPRYHDGEGMQATVDRYRARYA